MPIGIWISILPRNCTARSQQRRCRPGRSVPPFMAVWSNTKLITKNWRWTRQIYSNIEYNIDIHRHLKFNQTCFSYSQWNLQDFAFPDTCHTGASINMLRIWEQQEIDHRNVQDTSKTIWTITFKPKVYVYDTTLPWTYSTQRRTCLSSSGFTSVIYRTGNFCSRMVHYTSVYPR